MADGLAIRQPCDAHLPPRTGSQAFAHRARIVGGQTIESAQPLGVRSQNAKARAAATRPGARYGKHRAVERFPIKRGVKQAAGVLRAQLITPAKRAASPSSGRQKRQKPRVSKAP